LQAFDSTQDMIVLGSRDRKGLSWSERRIVIDDKTPATVKHRMARCRSRKVRKKQRHRNPPRSRRPSSHWKAGGTAPTGEAGGRRPSPLAGSDVLLGKDAFDVPKDLLLLRDVANLHPTKVQ
jgi:hypothetical protein